MYLLSEASSNAKTAKNAQHGAYMSYILHLAPARLSGYNSCPAASTGCAQACLNSAGRGAFSNVQAARIRKTRLFFEQRETFFEQLIADLERVQRRAERAGKIAVVRLNGTSDIAWETYAVREGKNVFQLFPRIQFYDYTKLLPRLKRLRATPINNYHVTFSRSESNARQCLEALQLGFNVAVVFAGTLPNEHAGYAVVDGDGHDLRFLDVSPDGRACVVGLKAKGRARKDTSGFVVQPCSATRVA